MPCNCSRNQLNEFGAIITPVAFKTFETQFTHRLNMTWEELTRKINTVDMRQNQLL